MSCSEELEKWRAEKRVAEAKRATQQQETIAAIERRAAELEKHLEERGAHAVGFSIEAGPGQIILKHNSSRAEIFVNVDVNVYSLRTMERAKGNILHTVPNSTRSVESIGEVDEYIVNFLKGREA